KRPFGAGQQIETARPQTTVMVFYCRPRSQGIRVTRVRPCRKPIFVASDQVTTPKESRQRQCEHNGRESVVKLKQKLAEEVAADAERRGPDNRATGIGDQKRAPGHAVYSGEERRQHAQ